MLLHIDSKSDGWKGEMLVHRDTISEGWKGEMLLESYMMQAYQPKLMANFTKYHQCFMGVNIGF